MNYLPMSGVLVLEIETPQERLPGAVHLGAGRAGA
jgi:hypothetical protein